MCMYRIITYALSDPVYFLCAAADPGLPVRDGISELLIFFSYAL